MKRLTMDRRTFLRGLLLGAGVSVALPPLEAMLGPNGDTWADGGPLPRRFGVWFWGNGVRPERWTPGGTNNWTPSEELAPLADLVPYVSVVTGCEIKTGTHPHHSGMTGVLTGAPLYQVGTVRDTIVSTFRSRSVDQLAAEHYAGVTPFRSLEVGITHFRGTDEGTTFQHLSHNGPNNVNPSEYSPVRVFERLFGTTLDSEVDLARVSVLDAVNDQLQGLQRKVGARDRQRLQQHFESVRALELRLAAQADAVCSTPDRPNEHPDVEGQEQIEAKNHAMSQLLALAMACDLTRSFSVLYSTAGSGVIVWQVGARNSLHQICHDEGLPQPTVHAATTFTMHRLGDFLRTLRDTPEGAGSLLDNCSILCTTELSDGHTHSNREFPILIAGKGGGSLRGGVHYRSTSNQNTSHAVLTALRAGGVPAASFGEGAGWVDSSLSALET
jgi:hypothetical protein